MCAVIPCYVRSQFDKRSRILTLPFTSVSENPFVNITPEDSLTIRLEDTFTLRAATLYKPSNGSQRVVDLANVTVSTQNLGVALSIVNATRINPYEV